MPATEQLNIRVTPKVKQRFRDRARREGMSQAQLLEALLKQRGTLPPPEPDSAQAHTGDSAAVPAERTNGAAAPSGDVVNFPTWLQGRTGVPRALCAAAVRAGRVTVAGVPYTATNIPPDLLEQPIAYEGNPV